MYIAEDSNPTYKLLLIEDNDIDRKAVLRSLDQCPADFDVDHLPMMGKLGSDARTSQYDIVVTDMELPDSSGLATIRTLVTSLGSTPIVVLTGTDDNTLALKAVNAGAQDYMHKQYIGDSGLLYRTLRHAMERHQLVLGLHETRDRESFLAHYDQCTALPNRFLFLDRIQQAVGLAQRSAKAFAVFFVDLDRFKNVNDTLGHSAGDDVLRVVSERMKSLVRDSDTVARFGGDEFVILLQNCDSETAMGTLAKNMIREVNKPVSCGHHLCTVGASIGISRYPLDANTPEKLLKNADMAMYDAKENGRNRFRFFCEELSERKRQFLNIETALREALSRPDEHFDLHYQPRVDLRDGSVPAVEALIRWQHPTQGAITPNQFIPVAEDLGIIDKIDEWVLERACQKSVQWQSEDIDVRIGINISGRSWNRRSFVDKVVAPILTKYNINGARLEMEMTEGVLISENQQVRDRLSALKDLGIKIALDDFGKGFSSLSYLNKFPIDTLKIDGAFMCDNNDSKRTKALFKAIIALGHAMEMRVVAERIETKEQLQFVTNLQCNEGQGFFLGKPSAQWTPKKS